MKHLLYSYAPNKLLNQSEREEPDKQNTHVYDHVESEPEKRKTHLLNHRAATYGVGAPWASHISLRPRAHSKFIKNTASGHSQIILLIEHEKEFSGGHRCSQTTPLASRIFLPSSLPSLLIFYLFISFLFHPLSSLFPLFSLFWLSARLSPLFSSPLSGRFVLHL
jgi:hypothetical protein